MEIMMFLYWKSISIRKETSIFAETLSLGPGLKVCERNNAYINQEYGVAFQWHTRAFAPLLNPRLPKRGWLPPPLRTIFQPAKTLNFTIKWVQLIVGSSFPVILA